MGVNVIRPRRLSAREVLSVRLEPELREALDQEAVRRGLTRSDLIRQALTASVDQDVLREAAAREQGGHQARNESRRGPARNRTSSLAEKGAAAAWPGQRCRCPDRTCPSLVRPRRRPHPSTIEPADDCIRPANSFYLTNASATPRSCRSLAPGECFATVAIARGCPAADPRNH